MQRHAEGCGALWSKQTVVTNNDNVLKNIRLSNTKRKSTLATGAECCEAGASQVTPKTKPSNSEWVVIPIFSDIVKLALTAREECTTM